MSTERQRADNVEFVPVPHGREVTQFRPGQSGNPRGRPKGSKHKLSAMLISEMCTSFEEFGQQAIRRVAEDHPVEYLKLYAALVRKWDVPDQSENPEGRFGWLELMPEEHLEMLQPFIQQLIEAEDGPESTGQQQVVRDLN